MSIYFGDTTDDELIEELKQRGFAVMENKTKLINIEPDAWATKTMCIGPEYGKIRYDKLPIQSLNPLYYTHEKLYSEKSIIGLMKASYYDGYTEKEQEIRSPK